MCGCEFRFSLFAVFSRTARGRREFIHLGCLALQCRPSRVGERRRQKSKLIADTCNMKKVFTAEQISDWFTSGPTFANIKLSDEAVERKFDEPASKETR